MRRALLPLSGLVVGTVLLISLRSAPGASRLPHEVAADALAAAQAQVDPTATPDPSAPGAPPAPDGSAAPLAPTSAAPGAQPPAPGPATSTRPPATRTSAPPPAATGTRTVNGESVYTEFGYVTVAITLSGTRIVDVIAVELPSEHSRSVAINDRAGPILRQRALAAQSADIDTVSGATYTSEGYRESLQSALDLAGLA
jgi:uncharacterized protein with FMN-binding domain